MPDPNWENIYDFFELAEEANRRGWRVVNCFQLTLANGEQGWQVNLQSVEANRAVFSEFAQHNEPVGALRSSMRNMVERKIVVSKPKATAKQEKRILALLEKLVPILEARYATRGKAGNASL